MSRRQAIAGMAAVAGAAITDGCAIEPYRLDVSRHELRVRGLPGALDGMRVAQISDVHFPGTPAAAGSVVDAIARERPEVVVLTGDMIEQGRSLPAMREFAAAVRGTVGTLAIFGNWERRAGVGRPELERAYDRAGVQFVVNGNVVLRHRGASVGILGLDDPVLGAPDLPRALAATSPVDVQLWLVHAPGYVDALPPGIPMPAAILAGHTHGGQIRLPGLTLVTPPGSGRYVSGWYPLAGGGNMYVSRGIGTAAIRARLFCPPELPIFTLRSG